MPRTAAHIRKQTNQQHLVDSSSISSSTGILIDELPRNSPRNNLNIKSKESTTAEGDLIEESNGIFENESAKKGRTTPDMVSELVSGVIKFNLARLSIILVVIWLSLLSYLFIQDNSNSKLDTVDGINWCIYKLEIITIPILIASIIIIVIVFVDNKSKKKN